MMSRALSLVVLLMAVSVAGWGYTIDLLNPANRLLWNTGWTSGGTYGTNDAADGHYTWVQWTDATRTSVSASGTAYIINDTVFPMTHWRPNIATTAAWVSTAAGPPNINAAAWYTYSTTFTLPNTYPLWNVNLAVDVWADNQVQSIGLYRGTTLLSSATPGPLGSLSSAHLTAYDSSPSSNGLPLSGNLLAPGTYTIRFDVYNFAGSSGNPTGLFVLFRSGSAEGVPEPATYALMGTVGLALYLLRRRKAASKG